MEGEDARERERRGEKIKKKKMGGERGRMMERGRGNYLLKQHLHLFTSRRKRRRGGGRGGREREEKEEEEDSMKKKIITVE